MSTPLLPGIRLLVVDDNPAIHEDVLKIFSPKKRAADLERLAAELFGSVSAPYGPPVRLDFALQGELALSLCQRAVSESDPYAVAFVDMRMPPGWDGLTTIEHLWDADPLLQVVICTAYSDHSWSDITERLGPRDNLLVLKKPFDGVELHQMATALGRKWMLQRMAIVDRQALETRMRLAERMASVGTLVGGVAHEINNPLAFVMANLQFIDRRVQELIEHNPSDDLQELAGVIRETTQGAERIRRTVGDLKTLSRAEDRAVGPIDVRRCMDLSISMAMNEIRHRARLVTQWEATPEIDANESRLGQVFLNLLMNAAQAISVGHASENEIRVSTGTDAHGRAVIEIADTGSGIPESARARIFEPFFTTKAIGEGTGLGLSISHGIVESFGGTIGLETAPGKGTTFRLSFPASAGRPAIPSPSTAPAGSDTRRRILIIDDELTLGLSLSRNLGEHDVHAVGSGREALDVLSREPRFDLILCDLMMPEMTGFELYEEIRRVAPQMLDRMVFMTGGTFTSDAEAFLKRVSPHVFEKPIDLSRLRSFVHEAAADAQP